MSNEEVLRRADAEDIEITLIKSRLRWLGHVSRMDDDRPEKALMYRPLWRRTIGNVCGIVNANRIATYQRQKEHRARKKAISGN